jgi:galactose mutarotase-like enzyme
MALPYFATKTVRLLNEHFLECSYTVENHGAAPIRYMWSAHPLISVPDSFSLEVPPGNLTFRTFPHDGKVRRWPMYQGVDLSQSWIPQGANLKVFITGMTEGWCVLQLPSHSLRFTFDLESVPVLGLWFNNYGFPSGEQAFRCIAVEPCTSPSDLLDELAPSEYPVLRPGEVAQWSLGLQISSRSSTQTE